MTGALLSREDLRSRVKIVITDQSNFTEMPRYLTEPDMIPAKSVERTDRECIFVPQHDYIQTTSNISLAIVDCLVAEM